MALQVGARLGPYEIRAAIGAGGMGEVYRAHDPKLQRDVAIKVLPQSVDHDTERLARLEREARVLASLNHPNIAQIHGLEESEGTKALVMELIEGPTLADRIAYSPIPLNEALSIANQIANALEAAHEQGIVHRDLKPSNIKLRSDGTVKVLDFGLAKALEPTSASYANVTTSPTITSPGVTGLGVLLGTAAYMSPEQARGKPVDRRADIWAFGCVLYEMLTGRRAFIGDDVSDVLASVLAREPDWTLLPSSVSPVMATYLKRCLHKDRRQRIADAQTVRLALEGAFETPVVRDPEHRVSRARVWRLVAISTAVAIAAAALGGTVMWLRMRPPPPPVIRTELTTRGDAALSINALDRDLVITPDGSRVVYRGNKQVFVRSLNQLTPIPLSGLTAARGLFMSPDGEWLGVFEGVTGPSVLKKVPISGGAPVPLISLKEAPRGATWGDDGTIIYATATGETGLLRISESGGDPMVLTTSKHTLDDSDHWWPEMLPGARAVLFTIIPADWNLDDARVAVLDLRTSTQKLLTNGYHARYVSSGHLVYGSGGGLHAVTFDPARLEMTGTAVPVMSQVATSTTGALDAVVAANGTLAYIPGDLVPRTRTLVWVDRRKGGEVPLNAPARAYVYAQLSPDETKVALDIRDEDDDIWIWDLKRSNLLQRLTLDEGINRGAVWSHDGLRVAFSRALGTTEEIYWQAADGSGSPEALTAGSKMPVTPSDFSPNGSYLFYVPANFPRDILMVPVKGPPDAATPLLNSAANESNPTVSPNGRWLAYESDESGTTEVWVRPFPDVNKPPRIQISADGGTRPAWSSTGRELFFYVGTGTRGKIMAVPFDSGPPVTAGKATMLFEGDYPAPNGGRGLFDVTRDGQRFLMIKGASLDAGSAMSSSIIVVQNWTEELKRLARGN